VQQCAYGQVTHAWGLPYSPPRPAQRWPQLARLHQGQRRSVGGPVQAPLTPHTSSPPTRAPPAPTRMAATWLSLRADGSSLEHDFLITGLQGW
jgi:hypothetical protein